MRIEEVHTDSTGKIDYQLLEQKDVVGYFSFQFESSDTAKLCHLSMVQQRNPTDLLDILDHILLFAKTLKIRLVIVETDHQHLIPILQWVGFQADKNRSHTWGYLCG
ncbi:hypothetical protein SAMN05421734_101100 [Pelagirhabdus alkalitolerans]|uniref:N-acetyltransferase domain-containing protein n=1 Tax=Pelagirhabdus alkalitolerans TaxID=1612202 RepID=A0A1G6GHJ3_9BACI|nr:hypothetical protein [Pelagirhabdus alkalitolerans]SDB81492.1 hypothetical protein SAMN05421734_101100 [Pelagirhabdus alkalitolerans]